MYWVAVIDSTVALELWVVLLAGGVVAVAFVYLVSGRVLDRTTSYLPGVDPGTIRSVFRPPIVASATIAAVWLTLQGLTLPDRVVPYVAPTLWTVAIGAWLPSLLRIGRVGIDSAVAADRLEREVAPIVQNVWTIALLLIGAGVVLSVWGVDVTPILASAGVAGIVLGFAARETIANFLASIALYADDTYQAGDYIELHGEDVTGIVRDVSIRSTTLTTLDGDLVTIPNGRLNEAIVTNLSTPEPTRRLHVPVGITYEADPTAVKDRLLEVAREQELVLEQPKPQVHLRSFEDSAMRFELLVWIDRSQESRVVEDRLNVAIHDALQSAGIDIPYPHRTVRFADGTALPAGGS